MQQVPPEQILRRLAEENPWWNDPTAIPLSIKECSPRPYLELFYPLLVNRAVRRAIVLMGPRRVGKTYMIHHAIQRLIGEGVNPKTIFYVSIDHPLYNGLGLEDLLGRYSEASGVDFKTQDCYIFFDEIQYLKDWERHLKAIVDRWPNVRCVASGSAAAALRMKSMESGAGRFTDFLLPPLTFSEYLTLKNETDLVTLNKYKFETNDIDLLNQHFVDYMNFGGYPEVALSEEIRRDPGRHIKSDIIDKVLLRDLPSVYGIRDVQELNSLFITLAFNTANEVSLEQLSQSSGVAKATIKRYIEYLEAAFLIRTVHRVDENAKHFRKANFFKVYLTNPSMRSALFAPTKGNDDGIGALVESAVFSQWFHEDLDLHYARWRGGEVDIAWVRDDQTVLKAIEVKWSNRFFDRPNDLKSLVKFCHTNNLSEAIVTTKTKRGDKQSSSVTFHFIPASLYAFQVGRIIIMGKTLMLGGKDPLL